MMLRHCFFILLAALVALTTACTPEVEGNGIGAETCTDDNGFVIDCPDGFNPDPNPGPGPGVDPNPDTPGPEVTPPMGDRCDLAVCSFDDDCGTENLCRDESCVVACERDTDCTEGRVCREGSCRDRFDECISGGDCAGVDLTGLDMTCANFVDTDFRESVLVGASLSGANLTRVDFSGANLSDANLTSTNLTRTDFTNATLAGALLGGADFDRVIWDNTICPDGINSDRLGDTCENNLDPDNVDPTFGLSGSYILTLDGGFMQEGNPGMLAAFSIEINVTTAETFDMIMTPLHIDGEPGRVPYPELDDDHVGQVATFTFEDILFTDRNAFETEEFEIFLPPQSLNAPVPFPETIMILSLEGGWNDDNTICGNFRGAIVSPVEIPFEGAEARIGAERREDNTRGTAPRGCDFNP